MPVPLLLPEFSPLQPSPPQPWGCHWKQRRWVVSDHSCQHCCCNQSTAACSASRNAQKCPAAMTVATSGDFPPGVADTGHSGPRPFAPAHLLEAASIYKRTRSLCDTEGGTEPVGLCCVLLIYFLTLRRGFLVMSHSLQSHF